MLAPRSVHERTILSITQIYVVLLRRGSSRSQFVTRSRLQVSTAQPCSRCRYPRATALAPTERRQDGARWIRWQALIKLLLGRGPDVRLFSVLEAYRFQQRLVLLSISVALDLPYFTRACNSHLPPVRQGTQQTSCTVAHKSKCYGCVNAQTSGQVQL